MRYLRRLRSREERGQALAEFAMIAPLLVILIFGFIDTARLYQAWVAMQHAAREGARYGVTGRTDCTGATQTRLACIEHTARTQSGNLTNASTEMDVYVKYWEYPTYADPGIDGSPGDQCDALEVRVEYDFVPSTPLAATLLGDVHLVARERLVNEPFGPCN